MICARGTFCGFFAKMRAGFFFKVIFLDSIISANIYKPRKITVFQSFKSAKPLSSKHKLNEFVCRNFFIFFILVFTEIVIPKMFLKMFLQH